MRYTTIGTGSPSAREVSLLSLGAMRFGTITDEATSYAILDRYVAAGGNFIDTSNNYLFVVSGTQGGESDIPELRFSPDGEIGAADGSILSYLRAEPGMTLVAYSPVALA